MFSEAGGIQRLQEGVDKKLEENRVQKNKVLDHKKSYQSLDERLTTLPDRITHDVMIPFTKKAFMPGKLIHTNEIQVLLGENYFLECSAKHAKQICSRRINQCDEMLSELEKEMKLVEGWKSQASQLQLDQQQCQDITEHFTEQQLSDWRKQHKESLLKEKKKEKESKNKEMTDEELWQRLEELEVREALEKEWERDDNDSEEEDSDDQEDDDLSEDEDEGVEDEPPDDDGEDEDESEKENRVIHIVDHDFKPNILKRRVSFAAKDDANVIRFTHSSNESEQLTDVENAPNSGEKNLPRHPGDLNRQAHRDSTPKSILKVPDDYDPSDHIIPEPEPEPRPPAQPFVNPVRDIVQENTDDLEVPELLGAFRKVIEKDVSLHENNNPASENVSAPGPSGHVADVTRTNVSTPGVSGRAAGSGQPPVQRVSKFKAMRQAQQKSS